MTFGEALAFCSNEETSVLLTNISLLYHQRDEWDKALLYAKQVGSVQKETSGGENFYFIAIFHEVMEVVQAMQAWPGNVKACFRAGRAQMRLGQTAAACASFSAGLQFVPGHR